MLVDERHSPMTVSRLLSAEGCSVSHEAIYQEVYRHRFGDPRRVLCRPRRSRRRRTRTGRIPDNLGDYKRLADRPGDPRVEPGHWEGDLLVGADNKTAVAVITDRFTRKALLGALPHGRNADHVAEVVTGMLDKVPAELRRSLTWDQGRELTRWARIEAATGTPIYFTEPRSPWQKPLVENQNALLRRWLPRNQTMPRSQATVDRIADLLNLIPRRVLGWASANNAYDRLRVATTG
jgi:transposase, IS30 family